jgi:hypothetical protein
MHAYLSKKYFSIENPVDFSKKFVIMEVPGFEYLPRIRNFNPGIEKRAPNTNFQLLQEQDSMLESMGNKSNPFI